MFKTHHALPVTLLGLLGFTNACSNADSGAADHHSGGNAGSTQVAGAAGAAGTGGFGVGGFGVGGFGVGGSDGAAGNVSAAGTAGVIGMGGATGTGGTSNGTGGQGGVPPTPSGCTAALPAPSAGGNASGPAIQVDVCAARHFISNDIYGVTFFFGEGDTKAANLQFAQDVHLPLNRSGGDATTRYNWQVDSSNAGFDWYFIGGSGNANPTPGASMDALITLNKSFGAKTTVTIPIIDYINKSGANSCSYPKSKYPNQQSYNAYVHPNGDDCGNGKDAGGNPITDTDPTSHDILNQPSIQKAWVQHLVSKFGTAANGGVPIYQMDNEPTGWAGIHFDVHPGAPTCEELRDKIFAYASAVKEGDPSAAVLGPGDIPVADDFDCNGMPRGEFILAAMADYEKQHGVRILDYYSHHYLGCCGGDAIDNAEKRIAKHKGWIAAKYPGTKLGYDEYNWGTDGSYATALLTADGLGVFGRDGVDMASFWGLDDSRSAAGTAFRLFRNYDGKGGAFGDVSVSAVSADKTKLHVYAAERMSDHAVTIVVVNKTGADITSALALSNHQASAAAHAYLFSQTMPMAVVARPDIAIADVGNIVVTYPADSATLLLVP